MRHLRVVSITAITAAFCLISSSSWAQQIQDQSSGSLEFLTRFLRFDPFLVAAIVIALTLVAGLGLDALRGRIRRSADNETPESN